MKAGVDLHGDPAWFYDSAPSKRDRYVMLLAYHREAKRLADEAANRAAWDEVARARGGAR